MGMSCFGTSTGSPREPTATHRERRLRCSRDVRFYSFEPPYYFCLEQSATIPADLLAWATIPTRGYHTHGCATPEKNFLLATVTLVTVILACNTYPNPSPPTQSEFTPYPRNPSLLAQSSPTPYPPNPSRPTQSETTPYPSNPSNTIPSESESLCTPCP